VTRKRGAWFEANVAFPKSLVDRITPSVSAEGAPRLNAASGLKDRISLVSEDFTQWVVEDRFSDGRPTVDQVGVPLSDEVNLWEQVKVRVLDASSTRSCCRCSRRRGRQPRGL
jgi:mannitol-1-phosphate/altronate dehydrogenase